MEVRLFELSNNDAKIRRIGLTNLATGHYMDSKYTPGKFELSLPVAAPFALDFVPDRLVLIDRWYWGVITGRSLENSMSNTVTIAGAQLTEWLHRRVMLPPDETPEGAPRGYDSCSGTTEHIMKQAVIRHAAEPKNEARKILGLKVADDLGRGTPDDAYLYRYAYLDEALSEIGKRANMGIKITGDEVRCIFTFDVVPRVDRTAGQTANKPLLLQMTRHNMDALEYTADETTGRNTFFCTRNDSAEVWDKFTQTYFFADEEPTGYARRECSLNVSVPEADNPYEAMETAARKEMESYKPTESLTCSVSRRLVYRKDYRLGDFCTVVAPEIGMLSNMEIVSVDTVVGQADTNFVVTFGESRPTRFDQLKKELKQNA